MFKKRESDDLEPDIAAAKRGDSRAFHRVYLAHVGRVNALCQRMLGHSVRADDAVQEVFVRAWRQLADFRGEAKFSTWLHRVAVHTAIDWWRKEQRHHLQLADRHAPQSEEPVKPHDYAVTLDLEAALAALPPQPRAVFVLHAIEGFGHREIGAWLSIAEGTSKAHYHQARKLLRQYLV